MTQHLEEKAREENSGVRMAEGNMGPRRKELLQAESMRVCGVLKLE